MKDLNSRTVSAILFGKRIEKLSKARELCVEAWELMSLEEKKTFSKSYQNLENAIAECIDTEVKCQAASLL